MIAISEGDKEMTLIELWVNYYSLIVRNYRYYPSRENIYDSFLHCFLAVWNSLSKQYLIYGAYISMTRTSLIVNKIEKFDFIARYLKKHNLNWNSFIAANKKCDEFAEINRISVLLQFSIKINLITYHSQCAIQYPTNPYWIHIKYYLNNFLKFFE